MSAERSQNPNEQDLWREKYNKLSPLERNQEFFQLFRQLPYSIVHEDPFAEVTMESADQHAQERYRRNNSQVRDVLVTRVTALLSLTKTTPQFQHEITSQYGSWYDHGVNQDHEEMFSSPIIQQLFDEYNDIEGIFNEDEAKEIERAIYKDKVNTSLLFHFESEAPGENNDELLDLISAVLKSSPELKKQNPEEYEKELEKKKQKAKEEREFMNRWPQAFVDLHGDEM